MGATVLEHRFGSVSLTLSPTIVASFLTSTQSFTCQGILTTDVVLSAVKPTEQAGLIVAGGRPKSAGKLYITFANVTGVGITPTAAEAYKVQWMRPDGGTRTTFIGT